MVMAFDGGLPERELQLCLDVDQDGVGFLTCGILLFIIYYLFFVKDKYCFCSYCC